MLTAAAREVKGAKAWKIKELEFGGSWVVGRERVHGFWEHREAA